MTTFVITLETLKSSPTFDISSAGKHLKTLNCENHEGVLGPRIVYTFEAVEDADLLLTIRKLKGDIHLDLPLNWQVQSELIFDAHMLYRLPKVFATQDKDRYQVGYEPTFSIKLTFKKDKE